MKNEKVDEKQLNQTFVDMLRPQNQNQTQDTSQNFKETIKAWLDRKYVHFKTRLNANQVIALSILKSLSKKWKVKSINELVEWFVTYKLSEGGKSSEELVDILKNRPDLQDNDELMKAIEPFIK